MDTNNDGLSKKKLAQGVYYLSFIVLLPHRIFAVWMVVVLVSLDFKRSNKRSFYDKLGATK